MQTPSPVPGTLDLLLGCWSVERTLSDYRSGIDGSFRGSAEVSLLGGRGGDRDRPGGERAPGEWARYEEVGRLRFGGHEGPAARSLRYLGRPDGTVLAVFPDGRPFVECDLRGGWWEGEHRCGADRYGLSFHVRSPDAIEEHWRVRGPSKDYEAWTVLRHVERHR